MFIRRLLPLFLLALVIWNVRADDDLPPDAKKLVEENEKSSEDLLKKAEAVLKKAEEKGAVKVTVLGGEQAYTGSTRNGVTTNDYGPWQGSYKLQRGKAARKGGGGGGGGGMAMADPGTVQNLRGQVGKTFLFEVT